MANLLLIPSELLQQITSFLPCSSVLNLLRVNHQLRNACNDRLVFQHRAQRDMGYVPVGIYNRLPWAEREFTLASTSLNELVRIAYAAEKGVEAAFAKDNAWTLKISKRSMSLDLSNWLPQMLVLQHSAVLLQMKPETLLEVQGRSHPHNRNTALERDFPSVDFIISYLLLHNLQYCVNPNTIKEPMDRFFAETRCTGSPTTTGNVRQTGSDSTDSLRQHVINYGEFKDYFDTNQAAALLPALILELATDHLSPIALNKLPVPSKIPFSSMLDIPALFQDSANPPLSEWHLKKMVNVEFLKGEWMGFYSDQRRGLHTRFFLMRQCKILILLLARC